MVSIVRPFLALLLAARWAWIAETPRPPKGGHWIRCTGAIHPRARTQRLVMLSYPLRCSLSIILRHVPLGNASLRLRHETHAQSKARHERDCQEHGNVLHSICGSYAWLGHFDSSRRTDVRTTNDAASESQPAFQCAEPPVPQPQEQLLLRALPTR